MGSVAIILLVQESSNGFKLNVTKSKYRDYYSTKSLRYITPKLEKGHYDVVIPIK